MEQIELLNLSPAEKPEKKKSAAPIAVNGAELADWLCMSQAAITQGRNTGLFVTLENGKYDLKASIRLYLQRTRNRQAKTAEVKDLDKQSIFWDIENKKTKNERWRMRYGQEIAMAIISQLTDIMVNAKNTIAKSPDVLAFFDKAIETLGKVDYDMALIQVEDTEENEIPTGNPE